MRLETYSLDFEDLILFAMLHEIRDGFYIDVGANDPSINSVTKIFYARGWSGINIEPLRSRCKLLEEFRPRDINLCVGIGSEPGEMFLYECPVSGLSTFSKDIAQDSFRVVEKEINPEKYRSSIPTKIMTLVHGLSASNQLFQTQKFHAMKNGNRFCSMQDINSSRCLESIDFMLIRVEVILPKRMQKSYNF